VRGTVCVMDKKVEDRGKNKVSIRHPCWHNVTKEDAWLEEWWMNEN